MTIVDLEKNVRGAIRKTETALAQLIATNDEITKARQKSSKHRVE